MYSLLVFGKGGAQMVLAMTGLTATIVFYVTVIAVITVVWITLARQTRRIRHEEKAAEEKRLAHKGGRNPDTTRP